MIKKLQDIVAVVLMLVPTVLMAQNHIIIPEPVSLHPKSVKFTTENLLTLVAEKELNFEAVYLSEILREEFNLNISIGKKPSPGNMIVLEVNDEIKQKEAYQLNISGSKICITGGSATGIFYGIQSLQQWMWNNYNLESKEVSCVNINDEPRYSYRALMLDPARHFLPVEDIKRYVDVMAKYKFNRLHLHLSDDQGWRIEIKKYPRLTEIGSVRKETEGNGIVHSGFYTQNQLRDLVAYAAKRHVTIIPEIDVPGHSVAAIAAYPHLTCFDEPLDVRTTVGVSKDLLCGGNDSVFIFLDDVIGELAEIFPGEEFHIGGDEAPLDHWKKCSKCQKRMNELNLESPQHLMSYFFKQVNRSLEKNNKRPLIWYELDVPLYPDNSTMFAWRNGLSQKVIKKSKEMGYQLIMSPGEHAYFDYPQAKGEKVCNWMPVLSLEQVYRFDPCMGVKDSETDHIIGVEATIWGEYVQNIDRAFYMTWPRGMALAEAGWSLDGKRDWTVFKGKLKIHLNTLSEQGVNYRKPKEIFK